MLFIKIDTLYATHTTVLYYITFASLIRLAGSLSQRGGGIEWDNFFPAL